MKVSAAFALSALFASSALAGPILKVRQSNDNDDDLLSAPTNGTQITAGGNLNFTYRSDDDDTTAVRVALVQIIEIARDLATTDDGAGGRTVSQSIALPADLAPGNYFLAVSEASANDDDNDDGDDDDDNDDDDDRTSAQNGTRYDDYDTSFETPNSQDDRRVYVIVGNSTTTA